VSDPKDTDDTAHDETPSTDELDQPSAEKNPDAEPKRAEGDEPDPDHEAFGIGIPGRPQVDPDAGA
jgi:hypothetical protein